MKIKDIETFLEVWDALGDLAELEEKGHLTPELASHRQSLIQDARAYEEATMRPPPKEQSTIETDSWFAIMRKAMAFREGG